MRLLSQTVFHEYLSSDRRRLFPRRSRSSPDELLYARFQCISEGCSQAVIWRILCGVEALNGPRWPITNGQTYTSDEAAERLPLLLLLHAWRITQYCRFASLCSRRLRCQLPQRRFWIVHLINTALLRILPLIMHNLMTARHGLWWSNDVDGFFLAAFRRYTMNWSLASIATYLMVREMQIMVFHRNRPIDPVSPSLQHLIINEARFSKICDNTRGNFGTYFRSLKKPCPFI